jgi:TolB-like protein/predicted Zn-dependent protease
VKIKAFIRELRRRSVFKVAIIYGVVGWLLVQVAVNAFPYLLLPSWTVTFVIALVIIGFPVAIVLAWAYELTPDGVRLTVPANVAAQTQKTIASGPEPLALAGPPASETAVASISVLPFQNFVVSGELTYLADAMTIELHSLLSRCHDLRVVSHQSSAAHAQAHSGIREISTQLGVQYVISGSVAFRQDKVVVTVELDDAVKDTVLWSERYEIGIDDVWDTQRRIAESVVGTFGGERMRAEIKRASEATGGNENARQLVQKARAYVLDYGPATIAEAKKLLQRALELDPDYADARAALGLVIAEATLNGTSEDWAEDRRAAIALVDEAETAAPNDPIVLRAAGHVQASAGNYEKSIALLRRATKLAPFDLGAWGFMGWPLVASGRAGDLAELHTILDRMLSSSPRHPGRAYWLFHKSVALTCADRCEEARACAEESAAEQPRFALGLMHYANVLGRLGQLDAARTAAQKCLAANSRMTPAFYANLMGVLTDQASVVDKRTSGLRASGLLA